MILQCIDQGPGIENIPLAMQEGYSTASEEVQEMGFGAGMGLLISSAVPMSFGLSPALRVLLCLFASHTGAGECRYATPIPFRCPGTTAMQRLYKLHQGLPH